MVDTSSAPQAPPNGKTVDSCIGTVQVHIYPLHARIYEYVSIVSNSYIYVYTHTLRRVFCGHRWWTPDGHCHAAVSTKDSVVFGQLFSAGVAKRSQKFGVRASHRPSPPTCRTGRRPRRGAARLSANRWVTKHTQKRPGPRPAGDRN
jgi:hypothetical protein